eukprot:CAMPEP_0184375128 /NCGR_PEP_ID=MMETSP1089-20130417/165389_1 /TAXON_ID=38269 ORGANISM="Gloeochaete wittrockiana, Strain SAG46.84" /NCGR_SAMPLE_ID=MMETSP1089 /ASSEMBLY_ACC=CAM_ASM_000445 /LENGTH=87 /DNA_ID=CAMNT_0026718179 /DNA_START=414 /DNA_END=677 /DNA_ORIENTATION=-
MDKQNWTRRAWCAPPEAGHLIDRRLDLAAPLDGHGADQTEDTSIDLVANLQSDTRLREVAARVTGNGHLNNSWRDMIGLLHGVRTDV